MDTGKRVAFVDDLGKPGSVKVQPVPTPGNEVSMKDLNPGVARAESSQRFKQDEDKSEQESNSNESDSNESKSDK